MLVPDTRRNHLLGLGFHGIAMDLHSSGHAGKVERGILDPTSDRRCRLPHLGCTLHNRDTEALVAACAGSAWLARRCLELDRRRRVFAVFYIRSTRGEAPLGGVSSQLQYLLGVSSMCLMHGYRTKAWTALGRSSSAARYSGTKA